MKQEKICLYEWALEQGNALADFRDFWEEEGEKEPDNFPSEMRPGDWDEHFSIFKEQQ